MFQGLSPLRRPLSFSLFYLLHSSHTSHCSPVTHTTIKRLPTHGSQLTYHTILNPLPTHSLSDLLTPLYFRLEFHLIFATDADATFKRKLINLRENKLLVKIIKPCCTMYSTLKFLILTNKTNINLTKPRIVSIKGTVSRDFYSQNQSGPLIDIFEYGFELKDYWFRIIEFMTLR